MILRPLAWACLSNLQVGVYYTLRDSQGSWGFHDHFLNCNLPHCWASQIHGFPSIPCTTPFKGDSPKSLHSKYGGEVVREPMMTISTQLLWSTHRISSIPQPEHVNRRTSQSPQPWAESSMYWWGLAEVKPGGVVIYLVRMEEILQHLGPPKDPNTGLVQDFLIHPRT